MQITKLLDAQSCDLRRVGVTSAFGEQNSIHFRLYPRAHHAERARRPRQRFLVLQTASAGIADGRRRRRRREQKIKGMLERSPELGKLPYKTVPLQTSQVNKELKVGDIKPLIAIDDYPQDCWRYDLFAITARPDVAYAVGKLSRGGSRVMHQPSKLHCDILKDVVGYMRSTISLHSVILASHRKSLSCSQN